MSEKNILNEDELDTVTGGLGDVAAPLPTGGVTYKCPKCGQTINAADRDVVVTCPNLKCRSTFQVKLGQLIVQQQSQTPRLEQL